MASCSPQWQERLSAWFDGEVDGPERAAVDLHVSRCPGCAREVARYGGLRGALRGADAEASAVPPELRARVTGLAAPVARPARPRRRWVGGGLAAALASVGMLWTSWPGGMNEALAMDVERLHLKAFSRSVPCEFESSDPAAVKAWVEQQVGYAVDVPEVPGATLLGARRCTLHGQLSASLLYRHGEQALTLFLPPAGSEAARDALRFAGDGPRCTQGPAGERICVTPGERGEQAALAVSELEDPVLLDALNRLTL